MCWKEQYPTEYDYRKSNDQYGSFDSIHVNYEKFNEERIQGAQKESHYG